MWVQAPLDIPQVIQSWEGRDREESTHANSLLMHAESVPNACLGQQLSQMLGWG